MDAIIGKLVNFDATMSAITGKLVNFDGHR